MRVFRVFVRFVDGQTGLTESTTPMLNADACCCLRLRQGTGTSEEPRPPPCRFFPHSLPLPCPFLALARPARCVRTFCGPAPLPCALGAGLCSVTCSDEREHSHEIELIPAIPLPRKLARPRTYYLPLAAPSCLDTSAKQTTHHSQPAHLLESVTTRKHACLPVQPCSSMCLSRVRRRL